MEKDTSHLTPMMVPATPSGVLEGSNGSMLGHEETRAWREGSHLMMSFILKPKGSRSASLVKNVGPFFCMEAL